MEKSIRQINREKWFTRIERYLSQDITQTSFCQEEDVNKATFIYWLKKYRMLEEGEEKKEAGFVCLTHLSSAPRSEEILLRVGQVELSIPCTLSLDYLIPFVKALS